MFAYDDNTNEFVYNMLPIYDILKPKTLPGNIPELTSESLVDYLDNKAINEYHSRKGSEPEARAFDREKYLNNTRKFNPEPDSFWHGDNFKDATPGEQVLYADSLFRMNLPEKDRVPQDDQYINDNMRHLQAIREEKKNQTYSKMLNGKQNTSATGQPRLDYSGGEGPRKMLYGNAQINDTVDNNVSGTNQGDMEYITAPNYKGVPKNIAWWHVQTLGHLDDAIRSAQVADSYALGNPQDFANAFIAGQAENLMLPGQIARLPYELKPYLPFIPTDDAFVQGLKNRNINVPSNKDLAELYENMVARGFKFKNKEDFYKTVNDLKSKSLIGGILGDAVDFGVPAGMAGEKAAGSLFGLFPGLAKKLNKSISFSDILTRLFKGKKGTDMAEEGLENSLSHLTKDSGMQIQVPENNLAKYTPDGDFLNNGVNKNTVWSTNTLQESIQNGQKLGIKYDKNIMKNPNYSAEHLEQFRRYSTLVNDAALDLRKHGINEEINVVIEPKEFIKYFKKDRPNENVESTLGFYHKNTDKIYINTLQKPQDYWKVIKDNYDGRMFSSEDMKHTIMHEIGHALHKDVEKRYLDNAEPSIAIKYVGGRAYKNTKEFISEVFARKILNKKPFENEKAVMKLYRDLGGKYF
jgi:hypothetical protein